MASCLNSTSKCLGRRSLNTWTDDLARPHQRGEPSGGCTLPISLSMRSKPSSLADFARYPHGFFGSFRTFAIGFGDWHPAGDAGVYAVTCGLPRNRRPPTWRQWENLSAWSSWSRRLDGVHPITGYHRSIHSLILTHPPRWEGPMCVWRYR